MTESLTLDSGDTGTNPHPSTEFNVGTDINGLAYQLTGQLPDVPEDFEFIVSIPDDVWHELQPRVEQAIEDNSWFAQQYRRTQQTLHLGDGRVGSVWVSAAASVDGVPTIHVNRIQTELGYLPEDSEYHDAKGVGSALLDNLCAFADMRGWRITLYPLERDGRLTGQDLDAWYERRSFNFGFEVPKDEIEAHGDGNMVRQPAEPDTNQPILHVLKD